MDRISAVVGVEGDDRLRLVPLRIERRGAVRRGGELVDRFAGAVDVAGASSANTDKSNGTPRFVITSSASNSEIKLLY